MTYYALILIVYLEFRKTTEISIKYMKNKKSFEEDER